MTRLGRWAMDHLNKHRRSPSQLISRSPSSEPPGTVHPQASKESSLSQLASSCASPAQHSGNLIVWLTVIRTLIAPRRFNSTKRRLEWVGWIGSGQGLVLVLTYLIAYRTIGCHKDTHHALQVQIHETTLQVDWMEQIRILKTRVGPCFNLPVNGHLKPRPH